MTRPSQSSPQADRQEERHWVGGHAPARSWRHVESGWFVLDRSIRRRGYPEGHFTLLRESVGRGAPLEYSSSGVGHRIV